MRKLSAAFLVVGIGLLAYLIYDVGPATLWKNLKSIGPSFGFVLAVGLGSMFFLACAWKDLLYPERHTATVMDLFAAGLVGFAVNELTPGSVAGEPVKGAMLKDKIPAEDIVSSLILHNYLYIITNFLQIAIGALIGLIWLDMSPVLTYGTIIVTVVVAGILVLLTLAIRWGMAEKFMRGLRFIRLPIKNMEPMIERAKRVDLQARTFAKERRAAFWRAFAWIFAARSMAVVELWVILVLIGHPAGFATLMLLQASTLLVYVVFFFVPSQMGANELGSTVIFELLRFNPATGLLMELVRRLRKITVVVLGLCIFGIRSLLKPSLPEPETAPAAAVTGAAPSATKPGKNS